MKNDKTRELVELSLYAALIIVSVQFIRIPFGKCPSCDCCVDFRS